MNKTLISMRGVSGSGKSTFCRQQGWQDHVISMDEIRLELYGVVKNAHGLDTLDQSHNAHVAELAYQDMQQRMQAGEFIVMDAMHLKSRDFRRSHDLAQAYGYAHACVDFSHVALSTIQAQNQLRAGTCRYVDPDVIANMHQRMTSSCIAQGIVVFKPHELKQLAGFIAQHEEHDHVV